jgi:hypothetical protein
VVRRPERAFPHQTPYRPSPRDGGDDRGHARLVVAQRWQQTRHRTRQERLARPGRTDHHQAVAAGQRYLHSSASLQLTSYLLEVRPAAGASFRCCSRGRVTLLISESLGQLNARRPVPRSTSAAFPEQRSCLGQRRSPHHVHATGQTRLNQPIRRHDDTSHSPPRQSHDHGKKPGNGPQFTAQR